MMKLISKIQARFLADDNGATAIEYGLIAVGIAVVIIAGVNLVGSQLSATFNTVGSTLSSNNAAAAG